MVCDEANSYVDANVRNQIQGFHVQCCLYFKQEWQSSKCKGEQGQELFCAWGCKGGAVVRALTSHQSDPGSNPGVDAICGLSLLLVLSFAPRGFSGYSAFPFSSKTSIFKFQFNQKSGRRSLWMCYLQIVILFSLSELSSPADRLLFTWQGFFANCCQMLKICTTGMLLI